MAGPTEVSSRDRQESITTYLTSKGIPPRREWLESFLRTSRSDIPLNSLQQTAYFQILTSDITTSVQPSSTFPLQVADSDNIEQQLPGPFLVQLIDIEDIGTSSWSQIEAIESQERGEMMRGREVIRALPEEQTTDAPVVGTKHGGPHKLCLQDVRGTKVYAIEMSQVDGVNISLPIGSKLLLTNLQVARGLILLQPRSVEIIGGKISLWDAQWRASRKERLREKIRPP